ncbi:MULTISPECIES: hypothetical protein [Pseudoclavibacter]|uniref:Uncharacterized protein n=1 Tax=Pseudoclavibacter helvolus TaxID=255205 RepID=A0A7W4UNA2_9MICO|nr:MULTISPECIES: hypothetical protein [Pseudoclavibacter]MBB2957625.1 hypothetical protein [Pseudoclavibacter helvolus]
MELLAIGIGVVAVVAFAAETVRAVRKDGYAQRPTRFGYNTRQPQL